MELQRRVPLEEDARQQAEEAQLREQEALGGTFRQHASAGGVFGD